MPFAPPRVATLASSLPFTLGQPSSSRGSDTALAAPPLWKKLQHLRRRFKSSYTSGTLEKLDADQIGEGNEAAQVAVSVQWEQDRRLKNRRRENLVLWVRLDESIPNGDHDDQQHAQLFIPSNLLPTYSNTPLRVWLRVHQPVTLDFVVLQPLYDSSSELDLSSLYPSDTIPGHIVRQGSTLPLDSTHRVLLTEPVVQGILSPDTQIITTPFESTEAGENGLADGDSDGASSYAKTHLSLADFDPDSFLSASLARPLSVPGENGDNPALGDEIDMASSFSSTSGSLTPRPKGLHRSASPAVRAEDILRSEDDVDDAGARFTAVRAEGKAVAGQWEEELCWVGVGGLGRAGVFEGDWVILRAGDSPRSGRLAQVHVWEQLDEPGERLPANPIILPPSLHRALLSSTEVCIQPTPFGSRRPTLPVARTMTLARIATPESMDKGLEEQWVDGLRAYFNAGDSEGEDKARLVRRGDIIPVPLPKKRSRDWREDRVQVESSSTGVVYFIVTALSFEPLVPPEEDFRTSASSKARAGELGCWVDVGESGRTNMVLTGVERARITHRQGDGAWYGTDLAPQPFSTAAASKMRDLVRSCFASPSIEGAVQLSVLIKGSRGSGKISLVRAIADELGSNLLTTECYDLMGETSTVVETTLQVRLEKAKACAPCIFVLNHVEALASRSDAQASGRQPGIVKVIEDLLRRAREATLETGFPVVFCATTADEETVPGPVLGCFKQEIMIPAPSEPERLHILEHGLSRFLLAPDVNLRSIAAQSAALNAGDLASLASSAQDNATRRAANAVSPVRANEAGVAITSADLTTALAAARTSYADSIGAPKIPNVSWDDVGGLTAVKADILDTIQLPLEHPELFASGLKKRSGILLYGPPGTGKTLLAKAVATSCSLNFLSVKGPELLNMYIGESEANVRRVFQRARDAAPCVIFMDELDSVAPKRGVHGDSGGVMDRIVSQLLAELDGMSQGSAGGNGQGVAGGGADASGNVFVMGATNRPDLLDPALLRPGRFDRMLYLDVPSTHQAQYDILVALTRKFTLSPDLSLMNVAESCPLHLTGADLYALCSDAMLRAMSRLAEAVDARITELEASPGPHDWPKPLTPAYYLATFAANSSKRDYDDNGRNFGGNGNGKARQGKEALRGTSGYQDDYSNKAATVTRFSTTTTTTTSVSGREIRVDRVEVGPSDFKDALLALKPSVSPGEMAHYRTVQDQFKGFSIVNTGATDQIVPG